MAGLMTRLLSAIGSSHYLEKIAVEDSHILHYKRAPTWRSLIILIGKHELNIILAANFCFCFFVKGLYFCRVVVWSCVSFKSIP